MSYATLQKNLEHITLKKDLDQALERMVEFEEAEQEVNRNNEESEDESEDESENEEAEQEESEIEENRSNFVQIVKSYLFGLILGISLATVSPVYKWKKQR